MLRLSKSKFLSRSILIVAGLFHLLLVSCDKSRVVYFDGTMLEAFQKAKEEQKRVFVLATDSTCGTCKSFEAMLDKHDKTREILNDQYISVKQELRKKSDHTAFELMRVPSYPFPFFFEADGTLLAFGFPESPDYDISDFSKFVIDPLRFKELFGMNINEDEYKKLVSYSMKGSLLLRNKPDDMLGAFDFFHRSAELYPYPYNLRYLQLLGRQINGTESLVEKFMRTYKSNPLDNYIYGKVLEYSFLSNVHSLPVRERSVIGFPLRRIDVGEIKIDKPSSFNFDILNLQDKQVVIERVDHPCDCMRFPKTSMSIGAKDKISVNGVFTPYATGAFSKEIYVHVGSPYNYSEIVTLTGTVN